MADLKLDQPETAEVEVDEKTLAAIDRGLKAAAEGRSVSFDEMREMIPRRISKFESRNRR
jgi:predicted transcriptional regulator